MGLRAVRRRGVSGRQYSGSRCDDGKDGKDSEVREKRRRRRPLEKSGRPDTSRKSRFLPSPV